MICAIDAHTHIFDQRTYDDYFKKARNKVEHVITLQYWIAHGPPRYPLEQLLRFADSVGNVSVMPCINTHYSITQQVKALGWSVPRIAAVKMYPGYQYFYPSDERIEPVVCFCLQHRKPLLFHTGATSSRGKPLAKYAHPAHIDELATRHPELRIIMAHLGFPHLLEAADLVSKHANVYADISGTIDKMGSGATKRLVARYIDDLQRVLDYYPSLAMKLLFGTDYGGEHTSLNQVEPYFEVVDRVFSRKESRLVYRDTASKVFFPSD